MVVESSFPGAIAGSVFVEKLKCTLIKLGIGSSKTLLASSVCPDEVNTSLYNLDSVFGPAFTMGGLAGMPFTGKTGFGAFRSHGKK